MKWALLLVSVVGGLLAADSKVHHVVEVEGVRLTVSTKKQGHLQPGAMRGMAMVYLKIENLGERPIELPAQSAYLRSESGKALRRITAAEANGILNSALRLGLVTRTGMMHDPLLIGTEKKWKELPLDPIPPNAWRDGLLFFEGTGDAGRQKHPVRLFLPPFITDGVDLNW